MGSPRGRRARAWVATAFVVALGLTACTADDGGEQDEGQAADELPVEVEGEVLDRRDPPADEADEPDEPDEAAATDGDDRAVADDEPAAEGAPADAPEEGGAAAPRTPSNSTPATPTPSTPTPSTPTPSTPAPTTPAPPSPAPTPVATPAPQVVAAGPARSTGPVLDSDGADWTETSSTSVERGTEPPALTVATRPGDDAPRRQVACAAALQAPSDRGLVARGTLTVSLRVVAADGSVQVLPRQRVELDVTLEPGRRLDLAVSPGRTFDVAEVRQVTCVADLAD